MDLGGLSKAVIDDDLISPRKRHDLYRMGNIKTIFAFFGSIATRGLASAGLPASTTVILVTFGLLLMTAIFIWGCTDFACSRGYPWQFGFFGVLGLCGPVVIIMLLPDRWMKKKHERESLTITESNYVRDPKRP
jgi:hypothetical protein